MNANLPTRRAMLQASANGFGGLALSALLAERTAASDAPVPHLRARAKNVIFCFMDGGVSHVDSFDPKPKLAELDGKDVGKVDNPTANVNRKWLRSPWQFRHSPPIPTARPTRPPNARRSYSQKPN